MHRILVPVDGSHHALKALQIAGNLAEKHGGNIVLFHVIAKEKSVNDLLGLAVADTFGPKIRAMLQNTEISDEKNPSESVLRAIGQRVLEQAASKISRLGIEVEMLGMEEGDPAESILLARQRSKANTIVMGARGVSTAGNNSFGSVSQKVFANAPCTCISVK